MRNQEDVTRGGWWLAGWMLKIGVVGLERRGTYYSQECPD